MFLDAYVSICGASAYVSICGADETAQVRDGVGVFLDPVSEATNIGLGVGLGVGLRFKRRLRRRARHMTYADVC